jgi:aspartyl-tRNA(Asn)/glutamyl-tRNA(Gln) amidotransferase subunit C
MKLSKEEIKYIANLARLELTVEEQKKYGSQLSNVLSFIEQLKEVDTTDCEPTAQVTGLENIFRADEKED